MCYSLSNREMHTKNQKSGCASDCNFSIPNAIRIYNLLSFNCKRPVGRILGSDPDIPTNGIVGAMAAGSFSGATGSGAAEYVLNDNANFTSITNATIEGAIAGSLVSGSTFLFTPAGSGVAGKAIGAMTSAPIDFTLSTI